MSYNEARLWEAYRQKRGTLNDGLRTEVMGGQLIAAFSGGKPIDYMPHIDKPEPAPLTPQGVMAALMKGVKYGH